MAIQTLKDVVVFALKNATELNDRQDLIEILDALDNTGNGDIDPKVDVIDSYSVGLVDEIIAQTDPSLFDYLGPVEKSEILHLAYERYSKTGTLMIDAINIELDNFSFEQEEDTL
jgi:hypothetical protein